ncbi:hypothetical protein ADL26_12855 [Thermoactinomyces vulgaris]|nr:hypothetical protein ADL26_12855 [Thermoactinomyces vulgaris]
MCYLLILLKMWFVFASSLIVSDGLKRTFFLYPEYQNQHVLMKNNNIPITISALCALIDDVSSKLVKTRERNRQAKERTGTNVIDREERI